MKKGDFHLSWFMLLIAGIVMVIIIMVIMRQKSGQAGNMLDWLRGIL